MYDDDEVGVTRWGRIATRVILVVAVAAVALFGYRALGGDGGSADPAAALFAAETSTADAPDPATADSVVAATAAPTTATTDASGPASTTTSTVAPATSVTASSVTASSEPATSEPTPPVPAGDDPAHAPVATLPDGSPVPVLAILDTDTITLSGAVPSQEAADRLGTLALANSKTPAALQSLLTVDHAVPANVGVRVVELNSARFPEGSDEIRHEHAVELDRVVALMNALPNVTALVIGHADQRGAEDANFAISEARARAVVSFLVWKGIAPDRLSSRAVGEADLLTLADDDAALALNRRTEFVFYGLLAPAAPS